MNIDSMNQKSGIFFALHDSTDPLVLVNTWDAGSTKNVAATADAKAIGTSSWSVAATHGYEDGEKFPFEQALASIRSIVSATDLPVTADIESAYAGNDLEMLKETARKIIEAGVVGINFEDQIIAEPGTLYSIEAQSARISVIRKVAQEMGMNLFINARTDLFFRDNNAQHAELMGEAIDRATAYKAAGADGFFTPGVGDPVFIKSLCEYSSLPVNIMVQSLKGVDELLGQGVARFSTGPFPYLAAMNTLSDFQK